MGERQYTDFYEFPEISATPATPSSGWVRLFARANSFYSLDDAGEVQKLYSVERMDVGIRGAVTVGAGVHRYYVGSGNWTFDQCRISATTSPTGASLIADVNLNGTTIYTTQANRPTISAGGTTAQANSPQVTAYSGGDYFTFDIDQVGSTVAGSNLMIMFRIRAIP